MHFTTAHLPKTYICTQVNMSSYTKEEYFMSLSTVRQHVSKTQQWIIKHVTIAIQFIERHIPVLPVFANARNNNT